MVSRKTNLRISLSISTLALLLPLVAAQVSARPVRFSGVWGVDWCSASDPDTDCGRFVLYLVQSGNRICGSYFGARPGLSQIDEGGPRSVLGVAVGATAVLSLKSERSGAIYLATARKSRNTLAWKPEATIEKAEHVDLDIVALDENLARKNDGAATEDLARVRKECGEKWK